MLEHARLLVEGSGWKVLLEGSTARRWYQWETTCSRGHRGTG